jgi:hypothetical protein
VEPGFPDANPTLDADEPDSSDGGDGVPPPFGRRGAIAVALSQLRDATEVGEHVSRSERSAEIEHVSRERSREFDLKRPGERRRSWYQ